MWRRVELMDGEQTEGNKSRRRRGTELESRDPSGSTETGDSAVQTGL